VKVARRADGPPTEVKVKILRRFAAAQAKLAKASAKKSR
jgi:hypothetical protein